MLISPAIIAPGAVHFDPKSARHLVLPTKRQERRIKNRLAKKRIKLLRFEQGDNHLVTVRVITEKKGIGRATYFCMIDMGRAPRRIADAIIANHALQ